MKQAALRPSFVGDEDVANYANLLDQSGDFATELLKYLGEPTAESWAASTIFGTLAYLDKSPCPIYHLEKPKELLLIGDVTFRAALAKHCDGIGWKVDWAEGAAVFTVEMTGEANDLPTLVLDPVSAEGQLAVRFLLSIYAINDRLEVAQAIAFLLGPPRRDDFVRAGLIQSAIALQLKIDLPEEVLDSNNLDVRRAVAEYERLTDADKFQERILARLGGQDEFYVELAGRTPLSADQLEQVSTLLMDGPSERRQAACVLAMRAPPEQVIELISDPDAIIRSAALSCATFNSNAHQIATQFNGIVDGYIVRGWQEFRRQLKLRDALEASLKDIPEPLQSWRLGLIDVTSGGFGLWNKGNRYWIREQRYLSLVSDEE